MIEKRRLQKKISRDKNGITTMQLSRRLQSKLLKIKCAEGFDKLDEALDEVITFYEDNIGIKDE
jgi:hypothetical protein